MSSVVPEPSICPSAKPASTHRNSAHHASDRGADAGQFAKLLDSKPASDPETPVRTKRNDTRTERQNDDTPAKGARRGKDDTSTQTSAEGRATASETGDATTQTSADAPKDAATDGKNTSNDDTAADTTAAAVASDEKLTDVTADALFAATPVPATPVTTIPTAEVVVATAPNAPDVLAEVPPTIPAATAPADAMAADAMAADAMPANATPADATPAVAMPAAPAAALPGQVTQIAADDASKEAGAQGTAAIQPLKLRPQVQAPVETSGRDAASGETKPAGEFAELVPTDDAPVRADDAEQPQRPTTAERASVPVTDTAARPHDNALKTGADLTQNLGITPATHTTPTQSTAATHAAAAASPTPAPTPAVPVAGLAVEIAAQSLAGKNRFEIRLDPPELGRIDVRLEIDNDGNVKSRLIVERAETLDMLRRDAPQLERALQQAGLKTSDNALEFSLRDQTPQRDQEANQNANRLVVPDEDAAPVAAVPHNYGRLLGLGSGLDIRV